MKKDLLYLIEQEKRKYEAEGFIIIGIFGSYSRSEERPGSDIDILYELSEKFQINNTGWNLYSRIEDIKHELEQILGLHVDLANKNALDKIGQYFILPEVVYVS
jgi:predicted nucleotidyltransferase